jgi:TLR4 regulator and MIR-interacting MSAP
MLEDRMSELRAYDLLDDVCKEMDDFTYVTKAEDIDKQHGTWSKGGGSLEGILPDGEELKYRKKQLKNYCGGLIGEYEDDIVSALKNDKFQEAGT